MRERHYKTIIYFISAMILVTLLMQGFWNYKNHQVGKQQLMNDVQTSLDAAVESYYANSTLDAIIGISLTELTDSTASNYSETLRNEEFLKQMEQLDSLTADFKDDISINVDASKKGIKEIAIFSNKQGTNIDTLVGKLNTTAKMRHDLMGWKEKEDATFTSALTKLTSKVIYGIYKDTLKIAKVDSLFRENLTAKNIKISHTLSQQKNEQSPKNIKKPNLQGNKITTFASRDYLPPNVGLQLTYTNTAHTVLKRNLASFLFSLLFIIALIACLLYLLKIIKHQKQLAEVKNDLISNITHEFKTPLATIGAAAEAIKNFNPTNDAGKNLKYATISEEQVTKMTGMVEKLLETATLDSDKLPLNFETYNLVDLLQRATDQLRLEGTEKKLRFSSEISTVDYPIDLFHFENAINNILDNGIKYGGNIVEVTLQQYKKHMEITISDSGSSLTPTHQKQIFEKFYRVPKGNTHDVKGFGIGLYYSKKIVEKHLGTITVTGKPNTQFKITLPNV
jgi:signal transduction histidine kinase